MSIVSPSLCRSDPLAASAELRILIVDDQLVIRSVLRSALEKLDRPFVVIEAGTGEEALSIMKHAKIDIIYCDIQLPGLSGPEALAHAFGGKDHRPFMVLMSTVQSPAIKEMGQRIGIYEFMQKPFKANQVLNTVEAYDRLQRVTRVLLVDDSTTARKLMARILVKSQFKIDLHEADGGNQAIELGKKTPFDVIFLDFNMPDMNGVEAAGIMLKTNPNAQIVLISTEQQAGMVRSAQFAGAFAFLKKPFTASDVDAVFHDAFAIKRPSFARSTHAIFSNEVARAPSVDKISSAAAQFGATGIA